MINWFVVQTHSRQEARAAIELARQEFHTYLPILHSKPMFPRYLFVRFNREMDNWGVIRSTRGCIDLLRNGFLPIAVREEVIETIRSYMPPIDHTEPHKFITGEVICVTDGAFTGFQGLFVSDHKERVKCLLEIFGGKREVEIPRESIRVA